MFSSHWPPFLALALKALTLAAGVAAAGVGWWASRLWLRASKVEIDYSPPAVEVSHEDNPALGILDAQVMGYATHAAYNSSACLNAIAARWTGRAAILTGVTALLGVL